MLVSLTQVFVAAIDGCGGVPPIRPLETLHNALSLRQLDTFLDRMTHALLYRTPVSSPPKHKSNHPPALQSPSNSEYNYIQTSVI